MNKGTIIQTEIGLAVVIGFDEDYNHIVHIVVGRNKKYVYNIQKNKIEIYFDVLMDSIFEDLIGDDKVKNILEKISNEISKK